MRIGLICLLNLFYSFLLCQHLLDEIFHICQCMLLQQKSDSKKLKSINTYKFLGLGIESPVSLSVI